MVTGGSGANGLKNELREFDKRSKIFLFKIILSILVDFALDNLWLSLGEN